MTTVVQFPARPGAQAAVPTVAERIMLLSLRTIRLGRKQQWLEGRVSELEVRIAVLEQALQDRAGAE